MPVLESEGSLIREGAAIGARRFASHRLETENGPPQGALEGAGRRSFTFRPPAERRTDPPKALIKSH